MLFYPQWNDGVIWMMRGDVEKIESFRLLSIVFSTVFSGDVKAITLRCNMIAFTC